jgi:hypothetical protein
MWGPNLLPFLSFTFFVGLLSLRRARNPLGTPSFSASIRIFAEDNKKKK